MNEAELFAKYRATGDIGLRNEIVERYFYVAEILAKKFVGRGVEYDDLLQIASLALIKGVERFDETKGVRNFYFTGLDGGAKITAIIERLRTKTPDSLAGVRVKAVRDYSTGVIKYADGAEGRTNQPLNNMIYFELGGGDNSGWVAVRPSGTEPKIKFYFGYSEADRARAKAKLDEIMTAVVDAAGIE